MRRQSSETQQISHDQCPHTDSVTANCINRINFCYDNVQPINDCKHQVSFCSSFRHVFVHYLFKICNCSTKYIQKNNDKCHRHRSSHDTYVGERDRYKYVQISIYSAWLRC